MINRTHRQYVVQKDIAEEFCGSKRERDYFKRVVENEKVEFIELGKPSSAVYARYSTMARNLYTSLFPNDDEREPWEVVTQRLADMAKLSRSPALQGRYGHSRFHVVLALNNSAVVGYSQASTLPVGDNDVLVYWQYGGVADTNFMYSNYQRDESFRRRGISTAYHPRRHSMAARDAASCGRTGKVIGTLIECEFIGQAMELEDIRFTRTRLTIHHKSGMMAMMLDMGEGVWVTAHIQPRLSADKEPIILQPLFRPLMLDNIDLHQIREIDPEVAHGAMMAFMNNFDCEGFEPQDVRDGRDIINSRFKAAKRVLLVPPEKLPNLAEFCRNDPLLKAQTEREYGPLAEHQRRIEAALRQP